MMTRIGLLRQKLNLFLYITGQRAGGYHTLQTLLFQFLDYGDTLHIRTASRWRNPFINAGYRR